MLFSFRSLRVATTVLALTSLAACSKKDDATPAATNPEGMSWTVDGNNVTAATAVSQATAVPQAMGTTLTVVGSTGSTGAASTIFLNIPKTAGTYTLTSTSTYSATYAVTPASGSSQFYDSTAGSIVVSSVTATNIVGTFTFTGATSGGTTKSISNGKFNVKL